MKRSEKAWLITAAALVLIGAAIFAAVMSSYHWNFSALGGRTFRTVTVPVDEAFDSIAIHADADDVEFLPSEDGTCRAVFYEDPKLQHTVSVEDRTLQIRITDSRDWYDRLSFFFEAPRVTLYLPQAQYSTLFVKDTAGDVILPEDLSFETISISGGSGDIDCRASATEQIRIEISTGDVHLENITAGELRLSVSSGDVEIRSADFRGHVGITVSTGKTTLAGVKCGSLTSDGDTGDVIMEELLVSGLLSVTRSTGDVSFERSDAAELVLVTDTGKVSGSLLTAKHFIAQSDTGSIEVPETATGGNCRITTSTGDIHITIA